MSNMENSIIKPENKKSKWTAIIVFLIIAFALAGYGYYWFAGVQKTQQEVALVINENLALKEQEQKLKDLRDAINTEKTRCQEFISQSQGDFSSFEYCKKFILWVNSQNLQVN